MLAMLVEFTLGLWWVALTSTAAAVLAVRAVWFGVIQKCVGAMGASALGFVALTYWLDILGTPAVATMDMRRGASFVLWPAIGWTIAHLTAQSDRVHR
jgi:hypothetical protein